MNAESRLKALEEGLESVRDDMADASEVSVMREAMEGMDDEIRNLWMSVTELQVAVSTLREEPNAWRNLQPADAPLFP